MSDGGWAGYADWKAPKGDGEVLVWPGREGMETAVREARGRVARGAAWLGVPLDEVRRRTRAFLGVGGDEPLVVTGHQTELHHPGVWVKNAVIHALAERWSGRAMHLAVDTDQPKHLTLRYPRRGPAGVEAVGWGVTDDAGEGARWAGRLSGPSPVYVTRMEREVGVDFRAAGFEPMVGEFLASMRRLSLEEGVLPPMLVSVLHQLDWGLGLRYDAMLASPVWMFEGFLLLVARVISDAGAFAGAYNGALGRYRAAEGIEGTGRPMPDLGVRGEAVELPFWLDDLGSGERSRPVARRERGVWGVEVGGKRFEVVDGEDGWEAAGRLLGLLRRANCRLAPRALMLTLFMRLAAADLFVHGIGGGRYDQVTDRVMQEGLGVEPPGFAVATATLYFPWAVGRERACLRHVEEEGHHLRHALLGEGKRVYLERIAGAARGSAARRAAFFEMHDAIAAEAGRSAVWAAWEGRMAEARREAAADEMIFDRELFYGLQPRERLMGLVRRVGEMLG